MTLMWKDKRCAKKKLFRIVILSVIIGLLIAFYVPIKDTILGVPFDVKKSPIPIGNNGFQLDFKVPCNFYYKREVGLIIDPPIKIESIEEAQSSISGNVKIEVSQGTQMLEKQVDLASSGWVVNDKGVWMKPLFRYQPLEGLFCSDQTISVKASNLNFNIYKHLITLYVSRDRRP